MVSRHARRVAIVKAGDSGRQDLVGIISPSDVLYVIQGSMDELGSLATAEVGTVFSTDPSCIVKVDESTTLDVAFDVMLEAGVSSVPVVDGSGAMVTILSFSDVKEFGYMKADEAKFALSQPVLWFLSPRKDGTVTALPMPPITVAANDAISTVIEVMVASNVHQVYIVDEARRPIGVVSMIELLGLLISPHVLIHPNTSSSRSHSPAVELVSYVPSSEFVARMHAISAGEFATREAELAGISEDLTTIAVSTGMPLQDVVSFVRDYSLRMVPVYEPEFGTVADGRKYVGWVSPLDIVVARKSRGLKDNSLPFWRSRKDDVNHLARAVMNFSNTDPYYAVRDGTTLSQVFAIVGGRSLVSVRTRLHCRLVETGRGFVPDSFCSLGGWQENLAVLDMSPEQWPIGIITPKYLIRFLNEVRSTLGGLALLPVSELMANTVIAAPKVTVEATVGEAVDALVNARVTTIPVVDTLTGKLVSALGRAEIHVLATLPTDDDFNDAMGMMVADYLDDFRAMVELDASSSTQTVRPTDTLNTVLELMTASGASAVHVLNDERQPIGLVTDFDVIRAVRPPTGGL
jgi:CBS domain-containing protein